MQKRRILLVGLLLAPVLLVATYALFGYHYAPQLLRKQAIAWVRANYGRELKLGSIRIDPFLLQLEIHDIRLPDADGQPLLGAGRLLLDLEVASLWRRAWVFREIALDQPALRAVLRKDGRINLADLAVVRRAGPPPPPTPLPPMWVQSLAVTGGNVEYLDAARADPLVKRIAPIAFALRDFRTTSEGGQFVFTAGTASEERFDWRGRFALVPRLASVGQFTVGGLRVATLLGILPDPPPVNVGSGAIDFAGQYTFALDRQIGLTVQVPQLSISKLALGKPGLTPDWVSTDKIVLAGASFDLAARKLGVKKLSIEGLKARSWLDAGGELNLQQLLPRSEAAASRVEDKAAASANAGSNAPPAGDWNVGLDALQVSAASVDFEDRRVSPILHMKLDPVNITTGHLGLDPAQAISFKLDTRIDTASRLLVDGNLTPAPLTGKFNVSLRDARLVTLQSYILPVADLTIRSGTVSAAGLISIGTDPAGTPVISYDGDASLDRLHTVDNALRADLLNVRRMQVRKLRYRSLPASLNIERVLVQEPYARLVISPERVINISAVFDPEGAAKQLEEWRAANADPVKAPPKAEPRRGRQRARDEREQRKAKAAAAGAAAVAALNQPDTFPIRIASVQVQKGRLQFSDLNIKPNFSAEIFDLQGSITSISSAHTARATVDLKGSLGEFSPVTIAGTIQPFAFDRYTAIGLKFENISLPVFNPYSGTFAGYNISKGALTTELRYSIENRKLDAAHHIRIDQLEWGEASEFKGEATLPVKFATALLRDRHGVINLDVPVSGSLDDPKLRVGPLIWQVVKNIMVKAATAPFALLGSLFSGAEEAQFVDFQPGDAALDAAAAERLTKLATALAEKSGISLDIPLAAAPQVDRNALAQKQFQQLLDAAAGGARPDADAATPPVYATLTTQQKLAALSDWFRAQKRVLPKLPAPPEVPKGLSRAEVRDLADQATLEFVEQSLREGISVVDGDLEQLAQARAAAIQGVLLRDGVLEPNRVFIVREERTELHDGNVRLRLELK